MANSSNRTVKKTILDDEVDLDEIFFKIKSRRKFIYSLTLISTLLITLICFTQFVVNPPRNIYSKIINVKTSKITENGLNTTGEKFLATNLITKEIIDKVYYLNELEKKEIVFDSFISGFSVITSSNNEKSSEITINFINNSGNKLSDSLIEKILNDVPKVWADNYVNNYISNLGVKNITRPEWGNENGEPIEIIYSILEYNEYIENILDEKNKDRFRIFLKDPEVNKLLTEIFIKQKNIKKNGLSPFLTLLESIDTEAYENMPYLSLFDILEIKKIELAEFEQESKLYKESMVLYKKYSPNLFSIAAEQDVNSLNNIEFIKNSVMYHESLHSNFIKSSHNIIKTNKEIAQLNNAIQIIDSVEKKSNMIHLLNMNFGQLIDTYNEAIRLIVNKSALISLYDDVSTEISVNSGTDTRLKKILMIIFVSALVSLMAAIYLSLLVKDKNKL